MGGAGFQTCCIADFQIGGASEHRALAGLETRDTADSEVCATLAAAMDSPEATILGDVPSNRRNMDCGGRAKRRHRFGFTRRNPVSARTISLRGKLQFLTHRIRRSILSRLLAMVFHHLSSASSRFEVASSLVSPSENTSGNSSKWHVKPPSGASSNTAVNLSFSSSKRYREFAMAWPFVQAFTATLGEST
jgi:hypothetical protein